ncbi:hypothetical protein [Dysgonomonas sp. 520]|uniref:rolling circle replication-associated protein n=1 Tax=Dysgonomonas sp. 520 TaxID=2302931 RepID=UPI0013D5B268|nr:hypothetical protein [Dysgonomonas sp. 520]NDW09063.1 hypothetical protein [Dysgonomonas sp. 520]
MGIILKENNIVYTKKRHNKLLGSSRYQFNDFLSCVEVKEPKLTPVIPKYDETEGCEKGFDDSDYPEYESNRPVDLHIESIFNEAKLRYELNRSDEDTKEVSYSSQIANQTPRSAIISISNKVYKERKERSPEIRLNKKLVREKCSAFFGLRQSRKFLAFYSISFPYGFPDDLCFKVFNTVLTRLREKAGFRSYLWVCERQKNGTLHFHMLTNSWVNVRRVNWYFAKAIETQIKKQGLKLGGLEYINKKGEKSLTKEFDVNKYNGVDIRHVNNNKKALNSYLTKYVSKNESVFYRSCWRCSHDISELFTAETFKNMDDPEFQYILKTINHIKTFVVDGEWATVEYFQQKQDNGKYFSPPDEWYWFRDYWNEQIYKMHHSPLKFDCISLN